MISDGAMMKSPWYVKLKNQHVNFDKKQVNFTMQINRWYVLYCKLKYIMTMRIDLKWDKGLKIILDNPKWVKESI
jgi:hypothetical protein